MFELNNRYLQKNYKASHHLVVGVASCHLFLVIYCLPEENGRVDRLFSSGLGGHGTKSRKVDYKFVSWFWVPSSPDYNITIKEDLLQLDNLVKHEIQYEK